MANKSSSPLLPPHPHSDLILYRFPPGPCCPNHTRFLTVPGTYQALSSLKVFELAVPSPWKSFPPDRCMGNTGPIRFMNLLKCHLLSQTLPKAQTLAPSSVFSTLSLSMVLLPFNIFLNLFICSLSLITWSPWGYQFWLVVFTYVSPKLRIVSFIW